MRAFGKVYAEIFDSSLRQKWQAVVTFMAMLALADENDDVDMTVEALQARTGFPGSIISEGIAFLEQPDEHSKSPEEGGRRIVRLDGHRPWGWHIVNRNKYKRLRDTQERRGYQSDYYQGRKANHSQPDSTTLNHGSTHTDTDTDTPSPTPSAVAVARLRSRGVSSPDPDVIELPGCLSREAWHQIVEHRKSLGPKGKLTPLASKMLLNRIERLHAAGEDVPLMVEAMITNNWRSVFENKGGNGKASAATAPPDDDSEQSMRARWGMPPATSPKPTHDGSGPIVRSEGGSNGF